MASFVPYASAALGIGADIANYIDASNAQTRAQRGLDQLSAQPWERYTVDPAVSRYYQTATNMVANPFGFTQGEKTNFEQNLGRNINASQAFARNMTGGNLGKAINFLGVNPTINAMNSFAGQDAELRRQYQNNAFARQWAAANTFQNVGNMNTQAALTRRLQALQAYGNAVNSNRDFKRNLLAGIGGDLLGAGFMTMPGLFGNKTSSIQTELPEGYGVNPTAYAPSLSPTSGAAGFNRQVLNNLRGSYYNR